MAAGLAGARPRRSVAASGAAGAARPAPRALRAPRRAGRSARRPTSSTSPGFRLSCWISIPFTRVGMPLLASLTTTRPSASGSSTHCVAATPLDSSLRSASAPDPMRTARGGQRRLEERPETSTRINRLEMATLLADGVGRRCRGAVGSRSRWRPQRERSPASRGRGRRPPPARSRTEIVRSGSWCESWIPRWALEERRRRVAFVRSGPRPVARPPGVPPAPWCRAGRQDAYPGGRLRGRGDGASRLPIRSAPGMGSGRPMRRTMAAGERPTAASAAPRASAGAERQAVALPRADDEAA